MSLLYPHSAIVAYLFRNLVQLRKTYFVLETTSKVHIDLEAIIKNIAFRESTICRASSSVPEISLFNPHRGATPQNKTGCLEQEAA